MKNQFLPMYAGCATCGGSSPKPRPSTSRPAPRPGTVRVPMPGRRGN